MPQTPPAPAQSRILVLLYGHDPRASLASLGDSGVAPQVRVLWASQGGPASIAEEGRRLGERLLAERRLAAFAWHALEPGEDWRGRANELLGFAAAEASPARPEFLLLLSATVTPEEGCLAALARRLAGEPALAGASPLLLSPPEGELPRRVRHMGSVFDSRRQIHSLYEGLPSSHPLAQKRRHFQVGPEDALMLRVADYCAVGGFAPDLEDLAPLDLCFRLGKGQPAFSTEPAALAAQADIRAGLSAAACWNSLVQRGRIPAGTGQPDYALHVLADGLNYSFTPWLDEGPEPPGGRPQGDSLTEAWLGWRHAPAPAHLLRLLTQMDKAELARMVEQCRSFPALLPHAFAWYCAQARHMEAFARGTGLPQFGEDVARWLRARTRFHHGQLRPGMRALADAGLWSCSLDAAASSYDAWIELQEPALRASRIEPGGACPEIAVIMPVWNPRPEHLAAALDSVLAQSYGRWQLCIADDASSDPAIPELLRAYAVRDSRIRLTRRTENGHISRASNSALALADAPWAAFLDHDDLLAPAALAETAAVIAARPGLACVYTDEDRIDIDGVRRSPVFKPGFDCDLFSVGHLTCYPAEAVRAAGGLRPGFEGSQDLDLWLRLTERLEPRRVAHIPRVLYHWRVHEGSTTGSLAAKPYVLEATRRALTEAAQRRGHVVEGMASERNTFFRLILGVPEGLRCSVILLADAACACRAPAKPLVEALAQLGGRMWLEVLWQPLSPDATAPRWWPGKTAPPPRVLPAAGPHWTEACVAAAQEARGDVLLFLHAGLTPGPGCRPEQMLVQAARQDVAFVGGLVWKGGRLWNGGLAPDVTGLPFPLLRGATPLELRTSCWGRFLLTRHVVGVAWQAMGCRRELMLAPHMRDALDARMGPLAGAGCSLHEEALGRFTLVSPWGQWEWPAELTDEVLTTAARARFLGRWGETVRQHPLRNANLCAAPDHGWRLMLGDGPAPAP
ncbi:glycosyltransferase [Desulfovibrio sp.]|uniref:glycosyltransferase family 2 protein n=1 Tax=Desulfovibrio sp. TaxID=885 RepID=UPI0023CFB7FF|nr:glycosyltransferase [Desulfovibrio sp.]MDE7241215.1 glycosyltransferase [Desulfovibrio sp.]